MQTSVLIRRHIFALPADVIFTTRDLLSYGSRASIDQTIYRYVKARIIVRLARGVFVRPRFAVACDFLMEESATGVFAVGKRIHSVLEIATAKAKAFGKEITKHGADLACEFGFLQEGGNKKRTRDGKEFAFAVNGRSSVFKIGKLKVRLQGVCKRKMRLTETEIGKVMLALWTLGKARSKSGHLESVEKRFTRKDRKDIRSIACHVPGWLLQNWVTCEYNYISVPKLASSFT